MRASRIEQTSCSELILSMHEQSEGRARTFCTTPGNAGSRADSPGSHTLSGPSSSCYADYGCTSRQKRCSLATPPQTIICSGRPIRISDTGLPCGPSSRQSRVCSCTGCSPALSAVVVGQHLIASPPSPRSLLSMLVARRCCPPTSITSAAPAPDAYVAPPAIVYFSCTRQLWHWASVSRQYALQVRDSRRRVCACVGLRSLLGFACDVVRVAHYHVFQ